jgi:hypothetical protein
LNRVPAAWAAHLVPLALGYVDRPDASLLIIDGKRDDEGIEVYGSLCLMHLH